MVTLVVESGDPAEVAGRDVHGLRDLIAVSAKQVSPLGGVVIAQPLGILTLEGNARLARIEYLEGKLTAEEFLRRIDMTQELTSYETGKAELVEEKGWQRLVAGKFSFDPETHYPKVMQVLDLREPEPKWKLYTAEDLRREDQKGHQSLREKYGKG